jgi:hypothetical protein
MGVHRLQGVIHVGEHSPPQRLRAAGLGIGGHCGESRRGEPRRRVRRDGPMRYQEGASAGIEEGAGKTRERLGTGSLPGGGIAGGKHHPVSVELEPAHLACGQKTIVEARRLRRQGQRERRLAEPLHVACNQPVGGEIDDAVSIELRALDRGLAGVLLEVNVARRRAERGADGSELIGGVEQGRKPFSKLCAIDRCTLPEL